MSIIRDSIYASLGITEDAVIPYGYLCYNADKKDDPIEVQFSSRLRSQKETTRSGHRLRSSASTPLSSELLALSRTERLARILLW